MFIIYNFHDLLNDLYEKKHQSVHIKFKLLLISRTLHGKEVVPLKDVRLPLRIQI